jgi:hypothetical protein
MRRALDTISRITSAGRTPHGYTLAIWSAGAACIHRHGVPELPSILLFGLGATVAFALLGTRLGQRCDTASGTDSNTTDDAPQALTPPWWSAAHVLAVPAAALASSGIVAAVPAGWSWLSSSAVATVAFVVVHAIQDLVPGAISRQR